MSTIAELDAEIARLEQLADQTAGQLVAAKARRARALLAERQQRRLERDAELARLAPADDVRKWAIEKGFDVGARGRLAVSLREQYIAEQPATFADAVAPFTAGESGIDLEATAAVRHYDQGCDSDLEADPRSADQLEAELQVANG